MEHFFQYGLQYRLQHVILAALLAMTPAALAQKNAAREDRSPPPQAALDSGLERRSIWESHIDSENFEAGLFAGAMSVENFGSNNVYGVRLAYHLTEDFFLEALYGQTETSQTSYEVLSETRLLSDNRRKLTYYNVSLGINILPGEVFAGNRAFNTNYYIIAGAGNTRFAGDEHFTYNFGAGFRFFASDWLALRVDFRNHLFSHDLLGKETDIRNLESHIGATIFF
jgi:outer membrane beta-barrel protein